jgi:hypothetical protein
VDPRPRRLPVYKPPSASFKRVGRRDFRIKRIFAGPKGSRLLSLMARILVRPVLPVVITLSLALSAGCSGVLGTPYDRANGYVADANEAIDEHNRLFEEARATYEGAKDSVETGETTTQEATSQEIGRFTQARTTMQEARDTLEEAREPLSEVQDLEVEAEIQEYAGLLSEAIDAQLAAENREINFYEILEQDPTLADNRQEAEDLLTEVDDGYAEAEDAYNRAQELADANPELLPEESQTSR